MQCSVWLDKQKADLLGINIKGPFNYRIEGETYRYKFATKTAQVQFLSELLKFICLIGKRFELEGLLIKYS